ncbi:MAG TPA: VanZ family protein [Alphaproteobacteria bacterium]|jgi:VanZ family protein
MSVLAPETSGWPAIPAGWQRAAFWAWIAGMATVAVFSLSPGLGPPEAHGIDKIFHCTGYFVLALQTQPSFSTRRAALIAALCMIPFGIGMEIGQEFVPGRSADPYDALANSIGALAGVAVAPLFRRIAAALVARL